MCDATCQKPGCPCKAEGDSGDMMGPHDEHRGPGGYCRSCGTVDTSAALSVYKHRGGQCWGDWFQFKGHTPDSLTAEVMEKFGGQWAHYVVGKAFGPSQSNPEAGR
jgi:hypothetical protein